ncbi:toxin glutamine deamidase domain-containing protein [Amycolatopsis azurea]|uniref:WXG100-like domain-containing protein n=1 Tax=Amycolatopsis azurea TaxID=36819 RepID=UPI003822A24D
MEMPDAVKWLLPIVVGESWPEGDEDKLRELRDAWHNASKAVQPIADTATKGATEILGGWTGEGAEKFAEAWKKFVEGDEAYFKSLADSSKALGDSCNATALDVEYTKYMIIISLVILAAQIVAMIAAAAVTFGGSTAGIAPAQIATRMTVQMIFRQLMQKLAQEGFKKVAKELLEKLLKEGLKKIGKEVLQNTAMNLAMDAGIQGLQMAKGDRDSWDFSKTKDSAISGAVDGVVGAGSSSIGKGATKGLSDSVGGQIVDSAARGAVRGAAEGVASTVGQAAVTGDLDKLSAKDLLMGASGGAVGGGVDGAKSQIGDIRTANTPNATPDVDGPSTPEGDSGDSGTPSRSSSRDSSSNGDSSAGDSSSGDPSARSSSSNGDSSGGDASQARDSSSSGDSSPRSDGGSQAPQQASQQHHAPSSDDGPQRAADGDRVSQSSTQAPERPADAPANTGDGQRAAQTHHNAPAAAADNGAGSGQQQQAPAANQQQAPAAAAQAPAQTPAASPAQTPAASPAGSSSPSPASGPSPSPASGPSQSGGMPPAASSGAPSSTGGSPASTGAPSSSGGSSSGGYGMASNPGPSTSGPSSSSGGYGMAPGGNPPGNGPAPGGFPPPGHDPSRPGRPNDSVQAAGLAGNGGPQQPRFDQQQPGPAPFQGQPMQQGPQGGFAPPPPPPGGGGGPMPSRGSQGQPGPMGPRPHGQQPPPPHPGQGGHPQDRGPRQRPQQPPQAPPPRQGPPQQGPPQQGPHGQPRPQQGPPQGYQGRPGPGPNGGVPPRPQTPPPPGQHPGQHPGQRGPAGYPPPPPRPPHPGNGPFPGNRGPVPPPPPGHHPGQPPQQGGGPRPDGRPQVPAPRQDPRGNPVHPDQRGQQPPAQRPQEQRPQDQRPAEQRAPQQQRPVQERLPQDRPAQDQAPQERPPHDAPEPAERPRHEPNDAPDRAQDQPGEHVPAQDRAETPPPRFDESHLHDQKFHTTDPADHRAITDTMIDSHRYNQETGEMRHEQVRREALAKRDATPSLRGMSDDGAMAVQSYTRSEFAEKLTKAQRMGGDALEGGYHEMSRALDSGLKEMPPYVGHVSRRVNFYGDVDAMHSFLGQHKQGDTVVDPQVLSTSKVTDKHPRSTFPGEVELRIHSKTGRDLEPLAAKPEEREAAMRSATQLKITGIEKTPWHRDFWPQDEHGKPVQPRDADGNTLPEFTVHAEEIPPGHPDYLNPDQAEQKMAERRAFNHAESERIEAAKAAHEAELARFKEENKHLFGSENFAALDGGAPKAEPDTTPEPAHSDTGDAAEARKPDVAGSATPLADGGPPVVHADTAKSDRPGEHRNDSDYEMERRREQVRLLEEVAPGFGEVNTRGYYDPKGLENGHRTNAAESLVAFEERMNGETTDGKGVAKPSGHGGGLADLGGPWQGKDSIADVARDVGQRPIGARAAVMADGRLFAAINTSHGVVFADPMTGRLASLPDASTPVRTLPLGGGDAPAPPEAPKADTAHTTEAPEQPAKTPMERLRGDDTPEPAPERAPDQAQPEQSIANRLEAEPEPKRFDEGYLFDDDYRATSKEHQSIRDSVRSQEIYDGIAETVRQRQEQHPHLRDISTEGAIAVHGYSTGEFAYETNEANRRGEDHPGFERAQANTKAVVSGLNEFPDFTGESVRAISYQGNARMSDLTAAHYEKGQITVEPTMTSASIKTPESQSSKFGDDVEIHIQSKTAKDISALAMNPGEREALSRPGTQLLVHDKQLVTDPKTGKRKWVIHAEEIAPGDPRYLDPEATKQKLAERRARHDAEAPEFERARHEQRMAALGGPVEPATPPIKPDEPVESGISNVLDDDGPEPPYGRQDELSADDTQPIPMPSPENGWSGLAHATNPPSEAAIHAGTATPDQQAAYVRDRHPELTGVNPHFHDPDAMANGYHSNCTRGPEAYWDRLHGRDATAEPILMHEMDSRGTLEHIEGRFGGEFSSRADYDTVIREMRTQAVDHHAVVAVKYLDAEGIERGHVAMVVNTRDGVAFIDPQSGALMNLPQPPTSMKLMHIGVPETQPSRTPDAPSAHPDKPVDPRIAFAKQDPPVDPRIAFAKDHELPPSQIGPDGRPVLSRDEGGYGIAPDRAPDLDTADPDTRRRAEEFLARDDVEAALRGIDDDAKVKYTDADGVEHDLGPTEAFIRERLPHHPELLDLMLHENNGYLLNSLIHTPQTIASLMLHDEAIPILEAAVNEVNQKGEAVIEAFEREGGPKDTPLVEDQRQISSDLARAMAGIEDKDRLQPGWKDAWKHDETKQREFLDAMNDIWRPTQDELNNLAREVAGTHGKPGWRTEQKNVDRALAKIAEYKGDVSKLTDLVGAKVEFNTVAEAYEALRQVHAAEGIEIVKFKDRFAKPQDSGYRDLQMNLRMSNGHIAEFRLHLGEMDKVAAYEHALYEVRRDFETIARDENDRAMSPEERRLEAALLMRERKFFWDALQKGLPEDLREDPS